MSELCEIQEWLEWAHANHAPNGLIIFLERTITEVSEDLAAVETEEYWKDELELPQ
jgi:hypothetical protein